MRQPVGIDRTIALGLLGAGALVGVAAPAASAATQGPPAYWSHLGQIKLYPVAGSAVDPLSNSVGTNLSGLPLSTAPVNAVFADGLPMRDLPLLGDLLGPSAATGTDASDPTDTSGTTNTTNPTNTTNGAPSAPAPDIAAPAAAIVPGGPLIAPAAAPQGPQFGPLQ